MQSISIPNEAMKLIWVDLFNLPGVDGFKNLIIRIDFFSKWWKQRLLKINLSQLLQVFYMKSFAETDVSKYK